MSVEPWSLCGALGGRPVPVGFRGGAFSVEELEEMPSEIVFKSLCHAVTAATCASVNNSEKGRGDSVR